MDIILWKDLCKTNEPPDIYMFIPVKSFTLETFPEVDISGPVLPHPLYSCYLVSLYLYDNLEQPSSSKQPPHCQTTTP